MSPKKLVIGLLILGIPLVSGHTGHDHSQDSWDTGFSDSSDGLLKAVVVAGEILFGLVLLATALVKYREDSS